MWHFQDFIVRSKILVILPDSFSMVKNQCLKIT